MKLEDNPKTAEKAGKTYAGRGFAADLKLADDDTLQMAFTTPKKRERKEYVCIREFVFYKAQTQAGRGLYPETKGRLRVVFCNRVSKTMKATRSEFVSGGRP